VLCGNDHGRSCPDACRDEYQDRLDDSKVASAQHYTQIDNGQCGLAIRYRQDRLESAITELLQLRRSSVNRSHNEAG
jgi:hypothetical protein